MKNGAHNFLLSLLTVLGDEFNACDNQRQFYNRNHTPVFTLIVVIGRLHPTAVSLQFPQSSRCKLLSFS